MSQEWYILQFKPNAHHLTVKNLNQQGYETFLPLSKSSSRKTSRFINSVRPLFPGYMFIKFDKEINGWHKINNTYGVSRLITFNSALKPIPSIIIDNLMKRCNLSGELVSIDQLKHGDQVKVSNGPFANFIATVEKYESDQRVWILMELMGRKTKIQAPQNKIQLLS